MTDKKNEKENSSENKTEQSENKQTNNMSFVIQRLYTKDVSFETPNSPNIFLKEWNPQMHLDLHTEANKLQENIYDIKLTVTVTVKLKEETAFLIEIHQCGIFEIKGFDEENLKVMLAVFCPNILYPYARETVSDLVTKGGFPPLYLQHVNFDALYQQQLAEGKKAKN